MFVVVILRAVSIYYDLSVLVNKSVGPKKRYWWIYLFIGWSKMRVGDQLVSQSISGNEGFYEKLAGNATALQSELTILE